MSEMLREYDAKLDSKKRVTLRSSNFSYFHVKEMNNGTIILEPRELTPPFSLSYNTLSMMDSAVDNLRSGIVSETIDLSEFEGD